MNNDPSDQIREIRHELHRREVTVTRVERISPRFAAITFGGEALEGFVSDSFDDHVKLMPGDSEIRRDYTPRHFDPVTKELILEIGLHGNGPGADWARNVTPGQTAVIGGPRRSFLIPVHFDWHLLIGDWSALPAIRRRLGELPDNAKVIIVACLNDPADHALIPTSRSATTVRIVNAGEWQRSLREIELPDGHGFVWGAGEASLMQEAKAVLRDEKGIGRDRMRITAYWKKGQADFHESVASPPDPAPTA